MNRKEGPEVGKHLCWWCDEEGGRGKPLTWYRATCSYFHRGCLAAFKAAQLDRVKRQTRATATPATPAHPPRQLRMFE